MLLEYDKITAGRNPKHMLGDQAAASKWISVAEWNHKRQTLQSAVVGHFQGDPFTNLCVALLPATIYNWTPHTGCRIPSEAVTLHFKGREKSKMLRAWHILLRAENQPAELRASAMAQISWLGVEEPENAIHRKRHTLIDDCPPL
eukprot:scaffold46865_cov48-Prasinocladus_malaysianus.AAC.1